MKKNEYRYYVYRRDDGSIGRLAKLGHVLGDYGPYGYENGKWVVMPGLAKIDNDVTADYEQISEAEAMKIMKEQSNG